MLPFPDTSEALEEPNGLLAVGGDLAPATLLAAYRRGIFPWFSDDQPILWWTPDPRAVLLPAAFHAGRSLRRAIARSSLLLRCNADFPAVIRACAAPRRDEPGTWISDDMRAAYTRLHEGGFAHSIEVWDGSSLVGGLYGVRIGRAFFGESMFSRVDNASKMALAALVWLATDGGLRLIDCQMATPHLLRLGARLLPRVEFENRLAGAIKDTDGVWLGVDSDRRPLDQQLGRPLPPMVRDLL